MREPRDFRSASLRRRMASTQAPLALRDDGAAVRLRNASGGSDLRSVQHEGPAGMSSRILEADERPTTRTMQKQIPVTTWAAIAANGRTRRGFQALYTRQANGSCTKGSDPSTMSVAIAAAARLGIFVRHPITSHRVAGNRPSVSQKLRKRIRRSSEGIASVMVVINPARTALL